MRGATRIQVLVLLGGTGALAGALLGGLAGVAWLVSPLPDATPALAAAVTILVAVPEAAGRPRPPSVRRQVPQLWGRLFGPATVAVLYGTRLGVGPATILPTWLWWGAFVLGAACGPWTGAAAGAAFALARTVATYAAVSGVREGAAMSRRMASVRRLERPVAVGIALALAGLTLTACSDDPADDAGGDPDERRRSATTLVLEPEPPTTTSPTIVTPEDAALDDVLLDETLPGFRRDDEAVGAGPLDLEAAARAEADVEAERSVLETRGFVRGASRAWIGPGEDVVYLAVYEFATPEGATAYLADGAEHLAARAAEPFDVPGIDGAHGFTTREEGFTGHAVAFTRGPRWFLVLLGSPNGTRTPAEAIDLATRL